MKATGLIALSIAIVFAWVQLGETASAQFNANPRPERYHYSDSDQGARCREMGGHPRSTPIVLSCWKSSQETGPQKIGEWPVKELTYERVLSNGSTLKKRS